MTCTVQKLITRSANLVPWTIRQLGILPWLPQVKDNAAINLAAFHILEDLGLLANFLPEMVWISITGTHSCQIFHFLQFILGLDAMPCCNFYRLNGLKPVAGLVRCKFQDQAWSVIAFRIQSSF